MRDKDDIPYAKTVLAVGDGKNLNQFFVLADGTAAIPLQPTVKNHDGSETTCMYVQSPVQRKLEDLIERVYPDVLEANHNIYNDRGILAPTHDNIDQIND